MGGETTIGTLIPLPIDIAVTFPTLGWFLNLPKFVRIGRLGKMPLGDATVAQLLHRLFLLRAILVVGERLDGNNRGVTRTCVPRFSRLPGLCRVVALCLTVNIG